MMVFKRCILVMILRQDSLMIVYKRYSLVKILKWDSLMIVFKRYSLVLMFSRPSQNNLKDELQFF